MSKRPTDFSQISLLSNQKAKLILLKNSIENNEHTKLCRNLELAKHGIKASHGKKRKDLEKRLERHVQDSLNVDDIKSLRRYIGDARDEHEFCSNFDSGRRSRSCSVDSKRHSSANQLSKLETRSTFSENRGKDFCFGNGRQSQAKMHISRSDRLYHTSSMPKWEESGFNSSNFGSGDDICHSKHSRTCPGETTDAQSKDGSAKVQRYIVTNKQSDHNEMLSALTGNSDMPDTAALWLKDGLKSCSKEIVNTETSASENADENNNSLEGNGSDNQDMKKSIDGEITTVGSDSNDCKGKNIAKTISEQRKDLKKGLAARKRLGPTPKESEEDVDGEFLEDENSTTDRPYSIVQNTSVVQGNDNMYRPSVEKHREMFPSSSNGAQTRRRRSSWAGRSITERLFKRNEFNESLPQVSGATEGGNGTGRIGLENWDRQESPLKPFEAATTDAIDCCSIAGGEHLTRERRQGCENFEGVKKKPGVCLQKANSVPMALGTQRTKIYSEEPFYIRPRRLTRRISWQSAKLSEETLKGLQEMADKAKSGGETVTDELETPLVNILPPITLQSIYTQQCNKEKRELELQERKQKGTQKKTAEAKSIDLGRLKDCRYLRLKKDPNQ